jgi:hypothetical protein
MPRMRTAVAVFAALALGLSAGAADSTAPVPAVRVGDTYQEVLAKGGRPASEINGGSVRVLYYPGVSVKLRNDVVVSVTATEGGGSPSGLAPAAAGAPAAFVLREDSVEEQIDAFRKVVLGRFESGKFGELEVLASHIIREKSLFGDGSWKILRLHEALELAAGQPEEKWSAREVEIAKWEAQFPGSITARTAHLGFLASYAGYARGAGSADSSMGVHAPLSDVRLAVASGLFQSCRSMPAKSPMLWYEGQRVALGQGWPTAVVLGQFEEAKRAEPEFWHYDGQVARFLLPKWHGKDGDWEKFEEAEIQRRDGLGVEEYARTVFEVSDNYKNVFKESHAEWALVKEGYAIMMQKYPASLMLVNQYALLAVLAADRPAALAAFGAMRGQADPSVWGQRDISGFKEWADRRP